MSILLGPVIARAPHGEFESLVINVEITNITYITSWGGTFTFQQRLTRGNSSRPVAGFHKCLGAKVQIIGYARAKVRWRGGIGHDACKFKGLSHPMATFHASGGFRFCCRTHPGGQYLSGFLATTGQHHQQTNRNTVFELSHGIYLKPPSSGTTKPNKNQSALFFFVPFSSDRYRGGW